MSESRYSNREKYFEELASTSRKHYLPYVQEFLPVGEGISVLEVGCGEGGNLLPFAQAGCRVCGLDLASGKIENARNFFAARNAVGEFHSCDFFDFTASEGGFDLILIHDVIEHIEPDGKEAFVAKVRSLLKDGGYAFWGFPDWYMPYGGHQQICRSKLSKLPFIHTLPASVYGGWLRMQKENPLQVEELLSIKRSKMTTGLFERLCRQTGLGIVDRRLWLVNPHYESKFNLRPRRLPAFFAAIPGLRECMSTSCHYMTEKI